MNFKVGDRVENITAFDRTFGRTTGFIRKIDPYEGGVDYWIDFDNDEYSSREPRWRSESEFRLIEAGPEPVDECAAFFS